MPKTMPKICIERENAKTARLFNKFAPQHPSAIENTSSCVAAEESSPTAINDRRILDGTYTSPKSPRNSLSPVGFFPSNEASFEYRTKITQIITEEITLAIKWANKHSVDYDLSKKTLAHITLIMEDATKKLNESRTSMRVGEAASDVRVKITAMKMDIFALSEDFMLDDQKDKLLHDKAKVMTRKSEFYHSINETDPNSTWRLSPAPDSASFTP